jgi:iron complex transport system substrate-binding protein
VTGLFIIAMTGLSLASLVWNPFDSPEKFSAVTSAKDGWIQVLSTDSQGREIRHAAGTTRVPLRPQRICALDYADELVALGIKPYAIASGRSWGLFEDYLGDEIKNSVMLPYGHFYDVLPCFDAIADCRPDLILTQVKDQHTYDQLSALAPTVALRSGEAGTSRENSNLGLLKRRLRDLAKVLGREAEAEAYIADFDRRLEEIRSTLGPRMKGKTIAAFRTRWGRWLLLGQKDNGGTGVQAVYDALDVKAPPVGAGLSRDLELEDFVGIDADYVIVAADDTVGAPQALRRMQENPLWKRMKAVREGHVLEIAHCNHWLSSGLVGKRQVLEDIENCVREGDPGGRPQ